MLVVSRGTKLKEAKTFNQFMEEAYLVEIHKTKEDAAAYYKKNPPVGGDKYYIRNKGPKKGWQAIRKSSFRGQKQRRAETIAKLNTPEEIAAANKKKIKLNKAGLDHHHIVPLHYSRKLKASMSQHEWEERVKRDAADGIYHGHHPKNIMGTVTDKTPVSRSRRGIRHHQGGAHELERKTRDIEHVGHKGLLSAAHRIELKKRIQ